MEFVPRFQHTHVGAEFSHTLRSLNYNIQAHINYKSYAVLGVITIAFGCGIPPLKKKLFPRL